MLIEDFHRNFKFSLDKMDGLNYPNFLEEEIDILLNQAQDRFVKQRYGNNNLKRTSFEETEKRTEDLRKVIETYRIYGYTPNSESIVYNSSMSPLPSKHWFTIWDRALIKCPTCNQTIKRGVGALGIGGTSETLIGQYVEVRPISHLELDKVINDPFKGPDQTKVLKLIYKDQVELILPEQCELVSYESRYIREPVRMSLINDITCELAEHTHDEILNLAVQIALEGIEAKRNQTFTPIIKNQEE